MRARCFGSTKRSKNTTTCRTSIRTSTSTRKNSKRWLSKRANQGTHARPRHRLRNRADRLGRHRKRRTQAQRSGSRRDHFVRARSSGGAPCPDRGRAPAGDSIARSRSGGGGGSLLRAKREDGAEARARARRRSAGDRGGGCRAGGILAAGGQEQRGRLWPRGEAAGAADGEVADRDRRRIGRRGGCDRGRNLPCHALRSGDEGGAMKLAMLLLAAVAAFAADEPRIVYSKSFPGSIPAYVEITLTPSGA